MQEAIHGHLAVMREFGDAIPHPTTIAEPMKVPA
jgi:predicted RNase H-like HicB family nuclease